MIKNKYSLIKLILLIASLGLVAVAVAIFVIVGFSNPVAIFPASTGKTPFIELLHEFATKVLLPILTFNPSMTGTPVFFLAIIGGAVFVVLMLVLWVFGIIRKRLHYLFSGLLTLLVGATYIVIITYFVRDVVEPGKVEGLPVIIFILACLGFVATLAFAAFDLLKYNKRDKELKLVSKTPYKVEETPIKEEETYTTDMGKSEATTTLTNETPAKVLKEPKKETKTEPNKKPVKVASPIGTGKVYHVSYRDDKNMWQVKAEKGVKVNKLFKTQKEALDYAKTLDSSVKVHSREGKIRKA